MGLDERAEQPGPHGALVIGPVALERIAPVPAAVSPINRREGPQTKRREQMLPDARDHLLLSVPRKRRMRQAHREDLVRPDLINGLIRPDDVVQALLRAVPERLGKGRPRALGQLATLLGPGRIHLSQPLAQHT